MITYAEFILEYPEFSTVSQERVEALIARASRQVDPENSLARDLIGLLTAHYLSANDSSRRGGVGGIKSISIQGEQRVEYDVGSAATSRGSLDQTSYGLEYQRLLKSVTVMFV